jgi:uncharacterized protein (DUF362 family)
MSKVMIHPATYEHLSEAIDRAFELFPLALKGKKVLIKPNVLRDTEAKEGVTTHPAVLRAVVEKVVRHETGFLNRGGQSGRHELRGQ